MMGYSDEPSVSLNKSETTNITTWKIGAVNGTEKWWIIYKTHENQGLGNPLAVWLIGFVAFSVKIKHCGLSISFNQAVSERMESEIG
jgi:hypothetical protein